MSDLTVATEIYNQIGKQAFLLMGAKNIAGDNKSLSFKIGENAKGVTHVKVELTPSDVYKVIFYKCKGSAIEVLKELDMVYNDMLLDVLEENTELYVSFFPRKK